MKCNKRRKRVSREPTTPATNTQICSSSTTDDLPLVGDNQALNVASHKPVYAADPRCAPDAKPQVIANLRLLDSIGTTNTSGGRAADITWPALAPCVQQPPAVRAPEPVQNRILISDDELLSAIRLGKRSESVLS